MLSKYIHYLKHSHKDIQKFHIALLSGVATGVFAFIYISAVYDTTKIPLFNSVKNEAAYISTENKPKEIETESPFSIFVNLFVDTKDKISETGTALKSVKDLFSNETAYVATSSKPIDNNKIKE